MHWRRGRSAFGRAAAAAVAAAAFPLLLLTFVNFCGEARAATLAVSPSGADSATCGGPSAPCRSIRHALGLARPGDTLELAKGRHAAGGELQPRVEGLTIAGATGDPADVVIDGEKKDRILYFGDAAANFRLRGVTLLNGRAWTGGCAVFDMLLNTSAGATVDRVVFDGCEATGLAPAESGKLLYVANSGGGAYFASGASPRLAGVVFRNCFAKLAGGGVWTHDDSGPVFTDSVWEDNKADGFGGGMVPESRSRPLVRRGRFSRNVGPFGGAVDSGLSSTARYEETLFEDNFAPWSGGAVYHYGNDRLTFSRCTFLRNTAGGGGGGAVAVSTTCAPVYEDCRFENSSTINGGGGHVVMTGTTRLTARRSTFRNSRAGQGGAFYQRAEAAVELEGCLVEGARSTQWGGGFMGIWGDGNSLVMTDTVVRDAATASDPGAALRLEGAVKVVIRNSRFENCSGANYGTIAASEGSTVTIVDTVITGNSADYGGAVSVPDDCSAEVEGGLVAGNAARVHGGAFYTAGHGARLVVRGTEVRGNRAPRGGALFVENAALVALVGARLLENRADYGAAVGVGEDAAAEGGAASLQANGTAFERNAAAVAGAVFYYGTDRARFEADEATAALTKDNAAPWGVLAATRPARIALEGPAAVAHAPGQGFTVRASLLDALGQRVALAVPPVAVELQAPAGLQVNTLTLWKVFKGGSVEFEVDVFVDGARGRNFTLRLASDAGAAELALALLPCAPGFSSLEGPASFRCLPCAAGRYNLLGDSHCRPCPPGASCPGKTSVLAAPGFWMDPASLAAGVPALYRCPRGFCCPDGDCGTEAPCAEARTGTLCGRCLPGFSDWGGQCRRCGSPQYALLVLPFLAGVALVSGSWVLSAGTLALSSGKVKSLLFFVQAVALVMQDEVGSLFATLSWDVLLASPLACPFQISTFHRTMLGYWVPAFSFIALLLAIMLALGADLVRSRCFGRPRSSTRWRDRLWYVAFQIASVAYIAIGNTAIKYLDCVPVGPERVLRRFPGVSCTDPEYRQWLPLAWCMLIVYTAGLPLLFIALVYRLSRKGALYSTEAMATYGLLYSCYRPHWKYYEVVVMGRRILLVALDTAFGSSDNVRALALFVATLAFGALHALTRPYGLPFDNLIESFLLLVLALAAALEIAVSAAFLPPEYPLRSVQYVLYVGTFASGFALVSVHFIRHALAARRRKAACAPEGEEEEEEESTLELVQVDRAGAGGPGGPRPPSAGSSPLVRPAKGVDGGSEGAEERPAERARRASPAPSSSAADLRTVSLQSWRTPRAMTAPGGEGSWRGGGDGSPRGSTGSIRIRSRGRIAAPAAGGGGAGR
eukprot:tig00000769_g4023.t1